MKNGLQKESELNGTTNGTRGTTRMIFGDATKAAKGEPQPKKRRLDLDKVLLRERGWSRHRFINMRETKQSRKGRGKHCSLSEEERKAYSKANIGSGQSKKRQKSQSEGAGSRKFDSRERSSLNRQWNFWNLLLGKVPRNLCGDQRI